MKTPNWSGTGKLKTTSALGLALAILAMGASWGMADIYRYVDENGVAHYTNYPTAQTYSIYMREGSRSVSVNTPHNRYDSHIKDASSRHQVDFDLIKAVIKVESSFDPKAVSKAGASGLMQIMPENYGLLGISDPYNPRQSINGGAQYLRQMLNRFDGKTTLALAAYNAGPTAVDKYKTIPPYKETQRYVRKVMTEYRRLRQVRRDSGTQWQVYKTTP